MRDIDETHAPDLPCWVAGADDPAAEFPIQNLPFGVYRPRGSAEPFRGGVAIGDAVLDLAAVDAATGPDLNGLAAAGRTTWRDLRSRLSSALSDVTRKPALESFLMPLDEVETGLPVVPRDYTDFFTSWYHAYNSGRLFRPDAPTTPNFPWMPIAYHGRASSIVSSGTPVRRPSGQAAPGADGRPVVGASRWLDYEVELGLVIGPGNALGEPVSMAAAEDHLFGVVLLNDWSARDLQAWEYQPLGPFLSKSFATTISPWIVTLEALAPFRARAYARPEGAPDPLPHLQADADDAAGHLDINLEAWLAADGRTPHRLSRTTYASAYWTPAQLVAHHTSNGCPLNPGDLLGTGTISGPTPAEAGSLLELSQAGTRTLDLPSGLTRYFLEDGDEVVLRADCSARGRRRIGFGAARGRILAAHQDGSRAPGLGLQPPARG